jgi:hypothetical protein
VGPCEECGDEVPHENLMTVNSWATWCGDCVEDHAHYCDECHGYQSEEHHHDDDDDHDDDHDSGGIDVHAHDYNPRSWAFKSLPGERVTEYYAIELEVAYNHQPAPGRTMGTIFAGADDVYFKHDGSIEDGSCGPGTEIVTHPCSWQYLQSNRPTWSHRLGAMRAANFRSFDAGNCGLHVHVSREPFNAAQLIRLQALIYDNAELFRYVSQRSQYRYCAFDQRDATDPRFRVLKAGAAKHGKQYPYFDYDPYTNQDRRVALNFPSDTPTVEFRFFRGTLNEASFWKALECAHSCVAFTRESNDTTADAYLRWTFGRARQYPNITAFLSVRYPDYRSTKHPRGTRVAAPTFRDSNS